MASRGTPKESSSFAGLSATETKLLVLANVCLKDEKIDYEKLALHAGIKVSSAQTMFRNAKRKLDKTVEGSDDAGVGNSGQGEASPQETPSKKAKTGTQTNKPRVTKTPKTLKPPKTPKTPKASKTPKNGKATKAALKPEASDGEGSGSPAVKSTRKRTAKSAPKAFQGASETETVALSNAAESASNLKLDDAENEMGNALGEENFAGVAETSEKLSKADMNDDTDEEGDHVAGELDIQATKEALDWAINKKLPSSAPVSPSPAEDTA